MYHVTWSKIYLDMHAVSLNRDRIRSEKIFNRATTFVYNHCKMLRMYIYIITPFYTRQHVYIYNYVTLLNNLYIILCIFFFLYTQSVDR